MTNKELQELLSQYPDNLIIRITIAPSSDRDYSTEEIKLEVLNLCNTTNRLELSGMDHDE